MKCQSEKVRRLLSVFALARSSGDDGSFEDGGDEGGSCGCGGACGCN